MIRTSLYLAAGLVAAFALGAASTFLPWWGFVLTVVLVVGAICLIVWGIRDDPVTPVDSRSR